MPCELVRHWDPAQPLLVGGLGGGEEGRGYLQLRLKRHRWFGRVLKTRDPLVFSVGWRRFQSVPVYATEDANGRHRCLLAACATCWACFALHALVLSHAGHAALCMLSRPHAGVQSHGTECCVRGDTPAQAACDVFWRRERLVA